MTNSDLFLPGLVLFLILLMLGLGLYRKVIAKLGLRNFYRHKGHAVISIAGLLVGTSIICASMVVGDSIEYYIVEETYNTLGEVDVTVSVQDEGYFDYGIYSDLASDQAISSSIDGISPILTASVVARNHVSGQFEPSVKIMGFDAVLDESFGVFTTMDGLEISGDGLSTTGSIINQALATKLDADVGDNLTITYAVSGYSYGGSGQYANINFTVSNVVQDIGKAIYKTGMGGAGGMGSGNTDALNIFVRLDAAQAMFNQSGRINAIKISNIGGVEDGAKGSEALANDIDMFLSGIPGAAGLVVTAQKQTMLEAAQFFNDIVSTFLTIFGSFAIIAGVILIINIFTMLAEERKSELGMARAVGMKRRHLMLSFLYEGLAYGTVAAAVGTLVGVCIGAILIIMVNNIIEFINVSLPIHFELFSLVQAFSLGFLITFVTILLTSWKISKLNIIRAIRGIEEPLKDRKNLLQALFGALLLMISIVIYYQMSDDNLVILLAPCGMITGLMLALWRWTGSRVSITTSSLGVLLYCFFAIRTYFGDIEDNSADVLFIVSGILIVLSFVLLVMYNSGPVIWLVTESFGRVRKWRPTVLTAVSYPLTKKFRTGMTVGMFALVVFMIAMLSVFSNMFVVDVGEETQKQGGGFDIQGSCQIPINDINTIAAGSDAFNINVSRIVQLSLAATPEVNVTDSTGMGFDMGFDMSALRGSYIYGVDDDFVSYTQYNLSKRSDNYATDSEAWSAVVEPGSRKVMVSSLMTFILNVDVGNHVTFVTNPFSGNVTEEFEVIGISDQSLFNGIFMSKDNVMQNFFVNTNQYFLFKVAPGYDVIQTASALERELATIGLDTIIIREMAQQTADTTSSLFVLFEIYLDMGMVVGVAGLGVITVRSVVERTPEIGILRSLGFKRKNIRNAFLIEILFVATIGVIIGIVSGVLVAHEIFVVFSSDFGEGIAFAVPWLKIATVVVIAYISTIICTIIPANNASKISPAEALRYVG